MTDVPLYTECVIGYRQWRLADWVLGPISIGDPWRPGVNRAACKQYGEPCDNPKCEMCKHLRGESHKAPAEECDCGLYALHEPPVSYGDEYVVGAVAAWGDLRVHHDGFRAEYAQIVALVACEPHTTDLSAVASTYGVPVVPRDLLKLEAERHGRSLPVDIRPPKPEPDPYLGAVMLLAGPHTANATTSWQWVTTTVTTTAPVVTPSPKPKRPQSRFERKQSNRQGPGGKRRGPKNIDPRGSR